MAFVRDRAFKKRRKSGVRFSAVLGRGIDLFHIVAKFYLKRTLH